MKFGYVWRGSGAKTEKAQRKTLEAYGVPAAKIISETSPARDERDSILSVLREGDEFCAFSAHHIADDIVELHWILASAAERGAYVYLIDFGRKFQGSVAMAQVTEDYVGARRKEQTKAARERLKKLPKSARGGRPKRQLSEEQILEFTEQWENEFVSLGMMAKHFKCHKNKLYDWAKELGLGEKARQ